MTAKSYRPWTPTQSFLLPPSPLDWLPEEHLAYFILDVVEQLDLGAIERAIEQKDPRGTRPYAPQMMTALLLYAYCVGVFSSRKIERATYEDVAFRVIAGDQHPYFTTINAFRLQHLASLEQLFQQVVRLARRMGLVKLGHVSLDGSKVQANASKHKAMSYERMKKEEQRLAEEIRRLLAEANAADELEDRLYGVGIQPQDLPSELKRREQRLARIREAKAALEDEARQARAEELRENARGQEAKAEDATVEPTERRRAATRARKSCEEARRLDDKDDPPSEGQLELPRHRVPHRPDGTPDPKAQRNFTDPDSRIMVQGGSFVQAYNAQIVVDEHAQIIVGNAVTNQPPDAEHLAPVMERVMELVGSVDKLSADSGYLSRHNVDYCEARGIDAYIAPGRDDHHTPHPAANAPARLTMREKLAKPEARTIYRRRKVIAEPPLGQMKTAQGFRRFSLRGRLKAAAEWAIVCTTHNLLKMFRATRRPHMA